jgi:transposase-like protein
MLSNQGRLVLQAWSGPTDTKAQAVNCVLSGEFSIEATALAFNVSARTVRRWLDDFEATLTRVCAAEKLTHEDLVRTPAATR